MIKQTLLVTVSLLFSAIPNTSQTNEVMILKRSLKKEVVPIKSELDELLEEVCFIDHDLAKAVINKESKNNHNSKSSKGAIGLMQLMPSTAKELLVNPYDKKDNLKGGCYYLQKQLIRFKNVKLALAAYNAGPGNVLKYDGIPPFKETTQYVKHICENYNCKGDV